MKILYLCPDIGIPVLGHVGGSAHVRGLVTALHRAGHSVVLVAPRLERSPWEKPASIDCPVIHLQPSTDHEGLILYLKEFVQMVGINNSRLSTAKANRPCGCWGSSRDSFAFAITAI